jgi:hypothetical protein
MTNRLPLVALLAALACGGSDNPGPACEPIACGDSCGSVPDGCGGTLACGACYVPPIVDESRLGIACPAPEVLITTEGYTAPDGSLIQKPAGDLRVGDHVFIAPGMAAGGIPGNYDITAAERVPNAQRFRVVPEDGRSPVFTPDHALLVDASCSTVEMPATIYSKAWVQIRYLRPGWCVIGQRRGIVVRVENAPDGDVIRLSVGENGNGQSYFADALFSLAHNSGIETRVP